MTAAIQKLKSLGHANVDYPSHLRKVVHHAVESWIKFCQLPTEDKCTFAFMEDSHGDGAGYELKEEKGTKKDLKENFHVTLFQYERLAKIANQRTFPFLHSAKTLLDGMESLIIDFASQVEKQYGVHGLSEEVLQSKPYWILRYLHYFSSQEAGKEIAAPHADKGGYTLHLYESGEGLQYLCLQTKTWKAMPVDEKQTVIIPAVQLQLKSKGELKALYHRVVATEESARRGRFSMVCFIPFEHTPKYNKKAHGNMQTHDEGFNYAMPHDQFSTLFHN